MIVIDSSAVLAIIFEEPEAYEMLVRLTNAEGRVMSVANAMEAHMVLAGRNMAGGGRLALDGLLERHAIDLRSVDEPQLQLARGAFDRFGKGRGHRAQLNFGDCFAYALAKSLDAPLLYKGNDFAATDIASAFST
ncbi:type II toxin-antitoxin system VapC family toxin [Sphingoaurantiacus capsulatus]|uniref:Type II toxin-antitoxin system VapC family toxin n=1 Tax=Sphingoaurantiacus capsulatus TaxID=1771310 RepID=A0ABV7X7M0_9SPHN